MLAYIDTCHFLKAVSGNCRIPYVSTHISPDRDAPSPTLQQTAKKAAEPVLDYFQCLIYNVHHTIEHVLIRFLVPFRSECLVHRVCHQRAGDCCNH
jgi:hypothetical protein